MPLVRSRPGSVTRLALTLACALACAACRSTEPAPSDGPQPASAPAAAEPSQSPPRPPPDPERPDKLKDLDDMCAAVDHDYADGTLGHYYAGLELRTSWGTAQRQAGDESIQPGRLLERAAHELAASPGEPALEHCRTLFDYLDDVE